MNAVQNKASNPKVQDQSGSGRAFVWEGPPVETATGQLPLAILFRCRDRNVEREAADARALARLGVA